MADEQRSTQRADAIRRRRASQAQQARQIASRRVTREARSTLSRPQAIPPVMARGPAFPVGQSDARRLRKVRRRLDVALDNRGTEMRLPALPRLHVGWRVVSLLLLGFLAFALYQLWYSPMYTVEGAQVSGLQRITNSEVNAVLKAAGQQVFLLSPEHMRQALVEEFPEFSAVSVQVSLPNTVLITVTERVPVLIWKQAESLKLVDADGMAFDLRDEYVGASYPIVEAAGDPPVPVVIDPKELTSDQADEEEKKAEPEEEEKVGAQPLLPADMVTAILTLAGKAPEGAVLIYDPQHGLGWRDRREWVVYFGDVRDIDMKLAVYRAVLDQLKNEDVRPTMISVEFLHAPYYRLERQ